MAGKGGLVIAIDGPVGAGKSTAARLLAARLGCRHVDTGAMYRALALKAQREEVDWGDGPGLRALLERMDLAFVPGPAGQRLVVDGEDWTETIRHPEVDRGASLVSVHPAVRDVMVARQRALGAGGGIVMDGRDIGTQVFPGADVKFYLDASQEERARRRHAEAAARGGAPLAGGGPERAPEPGPTGHGAGRRPPHGRAGCGAPRHHRPSARSGRGGHAGGCATAAAG